MARFTPPTSREAAYPGSRSPILRRLTRVVGTSVLLSGGSYRNVREPSAEDCAAAVELFLGGRSYEVSPAQVAALTAAGYGDFIS